MTLNEIPSITSEFTRPDCRTATRDFVQKIAENYSFALTLTLKDSWYYKNGKMNVRHYLSPEYVPKIYERFEYKLNKLVWKQKFYRHESEKLRFFKAWEDGWGRKRIHLHAALGNFPPNFCFHNLPALIEEAAKQCCEIDIQHKEDICNARWLGYITKEVERTNTDKILW